MRLAIPVIVFSLLVPSAFAEVEIYIACGPVVTEQPHVDVVFCIDRSGSMAGVIETAKKKVWSIVNEVAKAKPSPILRIGLIGYGDGEHIIHELALTTDLDEVYKHLTTYRDDSPSGAEFVGHAIHLAAERMQWSTGKQTLKIIYVVGNETARQGPADLDYAKTAPAAIARGIMVNAIYCGEGDAPVTATWRELARLADGQYMEIAGDGGAVVVATPFDAELAELNGKLNGTYVAFGARGEAGAANQVAQDGNAAALAPAVLADRVASKAARQYSNSAWDLVDASKKEGFDLKNVKDEDLPAEVRKLDLAGRQAFIEKKSEERAEIQESINDLAVKRDKFVQEETTKASATAPADSFDAAVRASLRKQAETKGFKFESAAE